MRLIPPWSGRSPHAALIDDTLERSARVTFTPPPKKASEWRYGKRWKRRKARGSPATCLLCEIIPNHVAPLGALTVAEMSRIAPAMRPMMPGVQIPIDHSSLWTSGSGIAKQQRIPRLDARGVDNPPRP